MSRLDDVMDLLNALETNLETLKHLGELGPLLDTADAQYFPHSLTVLSIIVAYVHDMELLVHDLTSRLRACGASGERTQA